MLTLSSVRSTKSLPSKLWFLDTKFARRRDLLSFLMLMVRKLPTSLLLTTANRGMRHRSGVIARYQSSRKRHSPRSCHYRLKWCWWGTQLPNAGRGWGKNDVWIRRLENTSRGFQIGTCTTTPHSRFHGCAVRIGVGDCCCSVRIILHWNICKNGFPPPSKTSFFFFFLKLLFSYRFSMCM